MSTAASSSAAAPARSRTRQFTELVMHLARREVSSRHRWTLLGWTWPVTRQLAQLGVLVFVFSSVFDLGIENYAVFVFIGLVSFTWFSAAITDAAGSLVAQRHLVFQPRFPTPVIPAVAVAVPFVDVLMAGPVLVVLLVASSDLHSTALFLPVLVCIQVLLSCGLAWAVAAAAVYLRDVPNIVTVGLLMLFYLTPVFYDLRRVPDEYDWLLRLNPLTTLIEGYRDVLLDGTLPPARDVAALGAVSVAIAAAGYWLFRRLQDGFVDEL